MHPGDIRISDFNYELPEERIARFPLPERDSSKLLVWQNSKIHCETFKNVGRVLPPDAVLVFNNTRVIRARLLFRNANGRPIEIFCLEPAHGAEITASMSATGNVEYNCLVGNLKQWKEDVLTLVADKITIQASIVSRNEGHVIVKLEWQPAELSFAEVLGKSGHVPIPPYLQRADSVIHRDRYQTVYAAQSGSVAAPTAGLHFTPQILEELRRAGVGQVSVTLHVGAGTFKPVKTEKLADHKMHAEWIEISAQNIVELAKAAKRQIIAVGTTSLRTLESLYWLGVKIHARPEIPLSELSLSQWEIYQLKDELNVQNSLEILARYLERNRRGTLVCQTGILIAPPYEMKVCRGLITNFHQPGSTLLLLVAAFTGGKWEEIYEYAIENEFRFLSYGDSSLLLK